MKTEMETTVTVHLSMDAEEAVALKKLLGRFSKSDKIKRFGLSERQADITSDIYHAIPLHAHGEEGVE